MYRQITEHCAGLSWTQILVQCLVLGIGLELITVWARWGLGLQATRDTTSLAALTLGLRIHHGYFGLLLMIVGLPVLRLNPGFGRALGMLGGGILASDLIHHFLVLWPLTGHHEFHIVYPRPPH
jgi:hypothetical protein